MYWLELHVHTEVGSLDSILKFYELLHEYNRLGVDGVCITEHICWKHLENNEYDRLYGVYDLGSNNEYGIDIFPGAEVKLENGYEYLVIGIKIPIKLFDEPWKLAINKIHKLGGLIIKSHPYREENENFPIDGMEIYNFCSNSEQNQMARKFADEHRNLTFTIGCDAHSVDVLGMAITVLDEKPKNAIELVNLLSENKINSCILHGQRFVKEEIL